MFVVAVVAADIAIAAVADVVAAVVNVAEVGVAANSADVVRVGATLTNFVGAVAGKPLCCLLS
jgi:3-deoxy-D-arabino-heptulosonate 7-phosphate (DAHP) synthase